MFFKIWIPTVADALQSFTRILSDGDTYKHQNKRHILNKSVFKCSQLCMGIAVCQTRCVDSETQSPESKEWQYLHIMWFLCQLSSSLTSPCDRQRNNNNKPQPVTYCPVSAHGSRFGHIFHTMLKRCVSLLTSRASNIAGSSSSTLGLCHCGVVCPPGWMSGGQTFTKVVFPST